MTKQEYAIKVLNDIKHHYQLQAQGFQMSLDMAIKALQQEDMLDKIRAEITKEVINYSGTGEEVIQAYADGLKKGLDIIDKYEAESEDKE